MNDMPSTGSPQPPLCCMRVPLKVPVISLGLGALWFAQSCLAQTPTPDAPAAPFKIANLPTSLRAPALTGFLGDPALGSYQAGVDRPQMAWHASGRLMTSAPPDLVDEFKMIEMWDVPADKSGHVRNLGYLNVGGTWALSSRSEWLCAQAFREMEEPPFYDQAEFQAISCFRLADARGPGSNRWRKRSGCGRFVSPEVTPRSWSARKRSPSTRSVCWM